MPDALPASRRVLEPHERVAEVLFGLIMVLTFTGSLSVAEAGRDDVRTMLIGALGCNLAWGIIDGVLYLMGSLAEKTREARMLHAVHQATDPLRAQRLVAGALPTAIAKVMQPVELAAVQARLQQLPEPPARARLERTDWLGAAAIFLIVCLSTFPVALPFVFVHDVTLGKRLSNAVAIVMLFAAGVIYGRCIGRAPWLVGVSMFALGLVLAGLTLALGG